MYRYFCAHIWFFSYNEFPEIVFLNHVEWKLLLHISVLPVVTRVSEHIPPARCEHSPFLAPCKHWMFLFTFSGAAVEVVLTQFCFIPCCEPPGTESNDNTPQILWWHRFRKGTGSCVRQGDRTAALLPSTVVRTRSSAAAVESESSSHLTEMRCFICRRDIHSSLVPEWLPGISGSWSKQQSQNPWWPSPSMFL